MLTIHLSQPLLVFALVLASTTAVAQPAEKAKPGASIAGKAVTGKSVPSKASAERKRYEFTGAGAVGAAQTTGSNATQVAPPAGKEKSGCHSSASDA